MAWVASRQLGLVTALQLYFAGTNRAGIESRLRRGILHRVHRGVYLVGHQIMVAGAMELAAVLACGMNAVVSHQSAAVLWGVAQCRDEDVHVTSVGDGCRPRPGIRVHRVSALDAPDISRRHGIPITAPGRTLLDFAGSAGTGELERAVSEAYALKLVSERQIVAAIDRSPRRPGAARLRAELHRGGGPQWTRSEAEAKLLDLLRAARLPRPLTNRRVAGFEADFLWPQHRLIVEVDGYQFHGHRSAFERDRRRDQAHVTAGYRVIRITWRQLQEEPFAVVATVARALGT